MVVLGAISFSIFSCLYFVDGALVLAKYFHFDSSTFGAASFYFLPSVAIPCFERRSDAFIPYGISIFGGALVLPFYFSAERWYCLLFLAERWCSF